MPVPNADVAAIFDEIADLLKIDNANPFRIRALPGFGERIERRLLLAIKWRRRIVRRARREWLLLTDDLPRFPEGALSHPSKRSS
jgi:DNA polymerase/3'-5' exonuclease PolX